MSGCSNVYRELPKLVPTEKKLLPADPAQQESLYRIWDEEVFPSFDPVPHWAYFYLLPHKDLLLEPLTRGVPWWEKATVNICYPLTAAMIRKGLGIDAVTPPTQAQDTIRKGFDYLDNRLADGRPYLMGDALTVLDIGTAALAAPAIFEPLYGEGGLLPPLEKTPVAMLPLIHELRERPAARYIARIYQQHRL